MKNAKNILSGLLVAYCLIFCTVQAWAQPLVQIDEDSKTKDFPKISINFYDRNPEKQNQSNFAVTAEGKKVDFKLEFVKDSVGKGNKNILVLIENGRGLLYATQREYFKAIMNEAVKGFFKKGDAIYLAEFHRMDANGNTLHWQNDKPHKTIQAFQDELANVGDYHDPRATYPSTDIHQALEEGISFMAKNKNDLPTVILLLSAEYNYDGSNRAEQSDVVLASRRADVPVYSMQIDRNKDQYNIKAITQETYGQHHVVDTEDLTSAAKKVNEMMLNVPKRYYGNNYRILFETEQFPNGSAHDLNVELNGMENFQFQYNVPGLFQYIIHDPLLLSLSVLFILAVVALVVAIMISRNKKRQREQEAMGQRLSQVQSDSSRALQDQEDKFRKTLQQKEQEERMAEERQRMEQLINESKMRFSRLPRKPSFIDEAGRHYPMDRLMLVVGREKATANILLDDASVSRFHANIAYEQGPDGFAPDRMNKFYIWDAGSTNGTYLNERPLPKPGSAGFGPVELHHNDVIRFGKVSMTFNH